jgi:hypothetical protein
MSTLYPDWIRQGLKNSAYTVYRDGPNGAWYAEPSRESGRLLDSSNSDSVLSDPVPLLNRLINKSSLGDVIVVKGNFSSANTLNFVYQSDANPGVVHYFHYGNHTYTGTGDAVFVNTALYDAGVAYFQGATLWINQLEGVNTASPFNSPHANSVGLHVVSMSATNVIIHNIAYIANCVFFDATSQTRYLQPGITSNRFYGIWQASNIAFHVTGSSIEMGGNHFYCNILGGAAHNLLVDAGSYFHQNVFHETIDSGSLTVPSIENNATTIPNGTPAANILLSGQIGLTGLDVLSAYDTVLFSENYSESTDAPRLQILRLQVAQKQIGLAYHGTSLAVTFPVAEKDASYQVQATFNFNTGGYWITSKTTTGCTINTVNSNAGGTVDYNVQR